MSEPLTHRLNQILPKLTSDDFLCTRGIGNEIAFYIFDYAPEDELRIQQTHSAPRGAPAEAQTRYPMFGSKLWILLYKDILNLISPAIPLRNP